MRGTLITRTFNSRSDFERDAASGLYVSHNNFTAVGVEWMWNMMLGNHRNEDGTLTDHLGSARLVVGDGDAPMAVSDERLAGDQTAQAELDGPVAVTLAEGIARATFRATFTEQEANFDWAERGVVTAQGVLLDRAVGDQGRKVLGAIWTLEAQLELGEVVD